LETGSVFGTNKNPELNAAKDYDFVSFGWQQCSIQPRDS
jgi:hypothetical protein